MLIRVTGRAEVTPGSDEPSAPPSAIRDLDGAESADVCSNYIASDLADLGVTGGAVRLTYDAGAGEFRVSTEYTSRSS